VVVVNVAGASSLGTMAAARWAAYDLFRPTDTDRPPIEVPQCITPHSRMEALLCARAKVTTGAWEHPEIKLRKLIVDGVCWSPRAQAWREAPIRTITLVREGGRPIQILFDDHLSRLKPGKQAFRLLVAMIEQALGSRGRELDVAALAADTRIWGPESRTEGKVLAQLRLLKSRYLKEALSTGETPRLCIEVREVNKQ
jgi:hypothetical protein